MILNLHTFEVELDEICDADYWHCETFGVVKLAGVELWRTDDPVFGYDEADTKQRVLAEFAHHLAEVLQK